MADEEFVSEKNKNLVSKLHEYYTARDTFKKLRGELIRLAVANGQSQKDAIKDGGAATYLDGYLVGNGVMEQSRIFSN